MAFNLSDQKFIPVLLGARHEELSLFELFSCLEEVDEIVGEAPQITAALYRFIIAIFQGAVQIDSAKKWHDCWRNRNITQQLKKYLEKWYDHFDLHHPSVPFLQSTDKDVLEAKTHPYHRLAFVQANNATVFPHCSDLRPTPMTDAEVARWLLAFQQFCVGLGVSKPFNLCNAPLMSNGGCCYILKGTNLYESIMLNLSVPAIYPRSTDRPLWERGFQIRPDKEGTDSLGFCDSMVWMSRRIYIDQQNRGVKILQGVKGNVMEPSNTDPMVLRDAEGSVVRITDGLWRNYHALFDDHKNGKNVDALLPACNALRLLGLESDFQVSLYGILTDPRNKAKILNTVEEHHHVYHLFYQQGIHDVVEDFVRLAVKGVDCVRFAARKCRADSCDKYDLKINQFLYDLYWSVLEQQFWTFMDRIAQLQGGNFDNLLLSVRNDWINTVLTTGKNCLQARLDESNLSYEIVHHFVWPKFYGKAKKESLKNERV